MVLYASLLQFITSRMGLQNVTAVLTVTIGAFSNRFVMAIVKDDEHTHT